MDNLSPDHNTSRPRYVQLDDPIGICYLQMRDKSFMTRTAQLFSTFQDSDHMDHESAYHWFQIAGKGGAVYG